MKNLQTITKSLAAIATLVAMTSLAWAGQVWNTELHVVNKTGKTIQVKNVKIRIKRGTKWKSWRTLQSGTSSIAKGKEYTKKKKYNQNFKYQFKADIMCKPGTWQSYTSQRAQDTSDFDANMFFTVKLKSNGTCDVKKTHDG